MFLVLTLIVIALAAFLGTALYFAYLESAVDFPLKHQPQRHSVLRHPAASANPQISRGN